MQKEEDNNLRAMKNTTTQLTRKQVAVSTDSRGPTCKQLRHHNQRETKPCGRRGIGFLNILQALTTGDFFLRVRTVIGCLEKNLQPTDGRCEQYTHKCSTYTVAQHHANGRGSRKRIAHLCVPQTLVIHVSCRIPCRT